MTDKAVGLNDMLLNW